jgi:hypothetical protein
MLAMRHRGSASLLVTGVAMAVVAAAAGGCAASARAGGSAPEAASTQARTATPGGSFPGADATASPSPSPAPWPVVALVPATGAALHQTSTRPPAHSLAFWSEMTDLWAGVVSGRPDLAMPAFFPLAAYKQVKAIAYPAADWQGRLVVNFRADIVAAHQLLGGRARQATLLRVIVPEDQANWISPGVCANSVGYWHVAGARLVYKVGGHVMSFGIATLISWRGRWYVVHLGGELRTSSAMVDQPATGPGVPGPPGGC